MTKTIITGDYKEDDVLTKPKPKPKPKNRQL